MPGPSNNRGKKQRQAKKQKRVIVENITAIPTQSETTEQYDDEEPMRCATESPGILILDQPPLSSADDYIAATTNFTPLEKHIPGQVERAMFQEPFIHDPGNGPRVRDAKAFMSSFFSKPPALDDPLCAEFAQEEVLQMLCTILPRETALILWYNKSRSESRVCPSCQRLYRLGDVLPDLVEDSSTQMRATPPQLLQEQKISGLCSPLCFIMASFNYPAAIKSAWGCMADEMDEITWELLNQSAGNDTSNEVSRTLGMLVKMTRLHDLGLAQLCFGENGEEEDEREYESALDYDLDYQPNAVSAY